MKRNTFVIAVLGLVPSVVGLSSCNGLLDSFGGEQEDLHSVNDLAEHVRNVHVETEVSKERLRLAVGALRSLTEPGYRGDAQAGFEEYVLAIEASEKQAKVLRKRAQPMVDSAERFFESWSEDLDDFQRAELRKRSKDRLLKTRKLYKQVEYSVEASQAYFDEINGRLRDYATYLSNDFNAESVASLEPDVREVTQLAAKLDKRFESCLSATSNYVVGTGMYGQEPPADVLVSSRD